MDSHHLILQSICVLKQYGDDFVKNIPYLMNIYQMMSVKRFSFPRVPQTHTLYSAVPDPQLVLCHIATTGGSSMLPLRHLLSPPEKGPSS